MPYVIALTGGISSGKSTVANFFLELGVPLVDTDMISRQLIQPGNYAFNAIKQYFGKEILHSNGLLNRILLREKIFNTLTDKVWLDNLLHPLIRNQAKKIIYSIRTPYVLYIVPLLIENKLYKYPNRILVVDAHPSIQIARTLLRDNTSLKQVKNILSIQASSQERLMYANDIIYNNKCLNKIKNYVNILHYKYLSLANIN